MRIKRYAYGLVITTPLVISAMTAQKPEDITDKI